MKAFRTALAVLMIASPALATAPTTWVTPTTGGGAGVRTDYSTGDKPTAAQISNLGVDLGAIGTGLTGANVGCSSSNITTNNTTTLTTVTGAAFDIGSGENWQFIFVVHENTNATANLDLAVTIPGTPDVIRYGLVGDPVNASATSATTSNTRLNVTGRAVDKTVLVVGYIKNSGSGTVQLKQSQTTANGSNTIVYAGTCAFAVRTP